MNSFMSTSEYRFAWYSIVILGIAASLADNVIMWLKLYFFSGGGLYLDTIFTIAAAVIGGLVPGLIAAVLTTFIYGFIYFLTTGEPYFWAWYFYILCSIVVVLLTRLFVRIFQYKGEPFFGSRGSRSFVMLIALSLVMCVVISIMGGIISACISLAGGNVASVDIPPEAWFRLGFLRQGFSLLPSEILGRIPVNMVDKTIAVFGGFGTALLFKKIYRPNRRKAELPNEQ
jgi:hypothetical protein